MQAMDVALLLILSVLVCSCKGARLPAPRKEVRIEGSVSCVVCEPARDFAGLIYKTAVLPGAVVKLQCNNTNKGTWEEETTTDSSGNFMFIPKKTKVTTWGAHKCKVLLVSSPREDCPLRGDYYFNDSGAELKPTPTNSTSSSSSSSSSQRFTVRLLSFVGYLCG